ncbi:hypothetical protein Vretimale_12381 [Volvox reticuliferus]|nr:hypothetical protein Vretimale_12381 [Volvox reticuliferus]
MTEVPNALLEPCNMLQIFSLYNMSMGLSPYCLLYLAISTIVMSVPIWLSYVFGSSMARVQVIAVVAVAVVLPKLARSLPAKLRSFIYWLRQNLCRSNWTQPTPEAQEAVQAILQLTIKGHVDCTQGRNRASASRAPSFNGISRTSTSAIATASVAADPPKSGKSLVSATANRCPEGRTNGILVQNGAAAIATYAFRPGSKSWNESRSKIIPLQASPSTSTSPIPTPAEAARICVPRSAQVVEARVNGSSLKAPVGLSRCTIVEDAPFPPPNTQVVMELHEKTLRVGGRRLRYRGYRPADRTLPLLLQAQVGTHGSLAAGQSAFRDPRAGGSSHMQDLLGSGTGTGYSTNNRPDAPSQSNPRQPDVASVPLALSGEEATVGSGPFTLAAAAAATGTRSRTSRPLSGSPHLTAPMGPNAALSHVDSYHPIIHMHPRSNNNYDHYNFRGHHNAHHSLSLSVKLSWAQPTDLPASGGGLLESLNEALASGSGYMVVGAAVRPGCILLQVDLIAAHGAGTGLLRGAGSVALDGHSRCGCDSAVLVGCGGGGGGGGGGDSGAELAAQLAYHVGLVVPTPPDGSEVLVSVGGSSSYSFSYDAPAAAWTARQLTLDDSVPEAGGLGAQATLIRCLQKPHGVRLRPARAALPIPAAADVESPPMLLLSLQLEVAEEEVATEVARQLRPLLLSAPALQQRQQQLPRHGTLAGWQLVANCIGRSLPVCVLRVVGPSCGVDSTADCAHLVRPEPAAAEHTAAAATTTTTATRAMAGGKCEVDAAAGTTAATTKCTTGGVATTGAADAARAAAAGTRPVVSIDVGVLGTREAVENASCRLAVLSVELWCGMQEVAQVPIMLVHESVALPRCPAGPHRQLCAAGNPVGGGVFSALTSLEEGAPGASSVCLVQETPADTAPVTSTGDVVVTAFVEELNGLAAAALFAGSLSSSLSSREEEGQCVQQMFTDLGILELYAASQVRRKGAAIQEAQISGGGAAAVIDDAAPRVWPHSCSSWSSDVGIRSAAADDADLEGLQQQQRQQRGPEAEPGVLTHKTPRTAALLLPGSLDMSCPLQRLLGRADPQQRQSMLLTGANLLSYTTLHGLPYTANAVRTMLAVLGCGLAEADELSAAAACASEDDVFGGELLPDGGGSAGSCTAPTDHLCAALERDDSGKNGLPLLHLAVLSGNISVVRMLLQWAREEGLGTEWLMRRHRGRLPLQLARAALVAANRYTAGRDDDDDDDDGSGAHVEYLAQLKQLLSPSATPRLQQDSGTDGSTGTGEDRVLQPQRDKDLTAFAASMTAAPPASSCSDGTRHTSEPSGGDKAMPTRRTGAAAAHAATPRATNTRSARSGANLPEWRRQRHPLLVSLFGYRDPAKEAQYQQFMLPYDVHVASYWIPLMCFFLACSFLRLLLRGGSGADPSEAPVAMLYAWPYVVMAICLKLRP